METNTTFFLSCMRDELSKRLENNPRYSLRAFARACDVSPGILSQFLNGKRVPSYKAAQKILKNLYITAEEQQKFLGSLASNHQGRGLKRLNPIFKKMKQTHQPKELSLELFKVIGDWYHYALLMLTCVENFVPETKWMASQIGISELEAKLAVDRLIEVGLLKKENGTYVCTEG